MDTPVQEFEARPYQICLYEKAVDHNSILYLPTGTGKTFIAVLLAKHMSHALTKPYNEGGKRTFFIVNTVALVHQQSAFFSRHTGLLCKGYSGDMQVDFWSRDQWREEIETNQVLVMTAQIFLNILSPGWISLGKVNLLIFDECHKAVKDHPMRQIMQRFEECPKNQQPRVLAMSASLLNSNVKSSKISETLKELEVTFHSTILTIDALESVKAYATDPKEFIEYYQLAPESTVVDNIKLLISYAGEVLKHLKLPEKMDHSASSVEFRPDTKNVKLNRILSDILEHLDETGMYGGSLSVLLHMIQLERIKKYADDQESIIALDFLITQLMKIRHLLESEMDESDPCRAIMEHSNPKVLKLLDVLHKFNTNLKTSQNFCCIIFVQRRFTAKVLYHILKKLSSANENFNFLKPEYMVGYQNDPYKNPREQLCLTKWNNEVLVKFRNGRANCLVATDVVDEGVDIPSCTLVIRYYAPQDFRAYIQSKGRARHSTSHYIILAPLAPNNPYLDKHQSYKFTEQFLHSALHGKSDFRSKPTDDEVDDILYHHDIQPYVIRKRDGTNSVITAQSAISLINIYCASLLKSKFIMLAPAWVKQEIKRPDALHYQVLLRLPPIAPVKETIQGDAFDCLDTAKRSAALKACVKLHMIGEFDENLLPKKVEDVLENTAYLFPFTEEEEKVSGALPGTSSKKRRHSLKYPLAMSGGIPKEKELVYLHIIRIKPTYLMPDESRHLVFYHLLDDGATFGILSTKKFANIPSFPIFMNVGDLQVSVDVNIEIPKLLQPQIELLKKFHFLVFNEVVPVLKDFMLFDHENLENCFLICPVNNQREIDWKSIQEYQSISTISPGKPLKVTSSEYEMALVRPTYRASHVYVVTSVCEYLFASSSFPTKDYESYVHYYKDRHDIEIEDETQPLLEVKPISKKINCIKPRYITGQISKRKRANLTEDFEEHLVPELCEILRFPAVYWLKGTVLPSILLRVRQLLAAEEFRVTISLEAQLSLRMPEKGHRWEPVSIQELVEQTSSAGDSTLDESAMEEEMDIINTESRDVCLEVDVLSEESGLYSWSQKEEPCDLERLADTVQLIDIEYYYKFMSNVNSADRESLKLQNKIKSNYKKVTLVPVPDIRMLSKTNPYGPSPADIMQSLTAKSAHDGFNLERSETLGDSFLKFSTSLFLYHKYQTYEEGPLTFLKGKMVGNLNLYYCGKQKNLGGRMNVEEFNANGNFVTPAYIVDRTMRTLIFDLEISPSILYEVSIPPLEKSNGMMSSDTKDAVQEKFLSWNPEQETRQTGLEQFLGVQIVPDKSVADCVEAIIGTYLLHLGVEGALKIVKWFQILPKDLDSNSLLHGDIPNPTLGDGDIEKLIPWAHAIESRLGYKFKNRALLLQAFTHPSFLENRITGSYQRLEFLGDALLDFLLTAHIYETCGNLSPGELTDLRSALVNNITFACLAVRYGLNTALLSHAPKLFEAVDKFVKFQEGRDYEVNDELLWVLLEEDECRIAEHVDVPKALGDIFESVIGAIYLDLQKDLHKTWQVIYCLMKKEIDLFSRNVPKQPIRVIHETPGAHAKFSVAEKIESPSTMMVTLSVIINGKRKYFHGFGATKKLAKCAASKLALKQLRHKRD